MTHTLVCTAATIPRAVKVSNAKIPIASKAGNHGKDGKPTDAGGDASNGVSLHARSDPVSHDGERLS
jgi:hypothetical protein